MFRYIIPIIALFYLPTIIFAQTDSVKCDSTCKIKEGIFISYQDFRRNRPVAKENIETDIDRSSIEFIGKTLCREKLMYTVDGKTFSAETRTVWGYYENNMLHINQGGDFYMVTEFGSISYMVATKEVLAPGFDSPHWGGGSPTISNKDVRNFLINFYDGIPVRFSMEEAEKLLKRDPELYKEYSELSKKTRKEQIAKFIMRYNERHPVYFLP